MREMQLACSIFGRSASQMVLDLAMTLLGSLHELLRQERPLKGRHAAAISEVGEVDEINHGNEKDVVERDLRPVRWSGFERLTLFLVLWLQFPLFRLLGS